MHLFRHCFFSTLIMPTKKSQSSYLQAWSKWKPFPLLSSSPFSLLSLQSTKSWCLFASSKSIAAVKEMTQSSCYGDTRITWLTTLSSLSSSCCSSGSEARCLTTTKELGFCTAIRFWTSSYSFFNSYITSHL